MVIIWWNWIWSQYKAEKGNLYLQFISRWTNQRVKTWERAPFWCTLLVFTRYYGKCFMPPIIVHQAKEYSKDVHFGIPLDWTVHHTPYDYMDRDVWIKIHEPIIQRMRRLPCKWTNNFLLWKLQPLWWPFTYTYGAPKHPTLHPEIRRLYKLPPQL